MDMLIDAHCHLERIPKYALLPDVLPVTVGYSHGSNKRTVAVAEKLKIPFVLGIAPQSAIKEDISALDEWMDYIRENKPNAIGEIGLDYHWAKNEGHIEKEKIVFSRMLDLAEEMKLPIVIHARKATHDVLDTLALRRFRYPFMMHFFSGTLGEAKRAVEMGGLISIPPLRSKERREIIKAISLEHLLVETDAPYVARLPENAMEAVDYISEVKNIMKEEVLKATANNAIKLFNIEVD